ncbi:hypothetical protein DH2020_013539 [Rehmannia glutinosa]|uniref:BHLH domain-containing protein n=1 Tax=Rehmannia glutinosa TaxID=99300 RepID=A0ABR0X6A0_REHGL
MAAFSSFQLLDSSVFLPNNAFSQFYQHETLQNFDHSTKNLSVTNKNSMDSSSILTDKFSTEKITQRAIFPMDKKRKFKEGSSANCAQSKDMREMKGKRQKKMKNCEENNNNNNSKEENKGYIHVRARRGQATDSHSLAERVRRERISERMKILQGLVPGCDKFLSMKLASLNPMFYDFGMDLEQFMVSPGQNLSSLPSPLPGMQECSPTTGNTYPLLDNNNSANSLLLKQPQIPNTLPQGHRHVLWEVDEQRQQIINQSEISNTLFTFH